MRTYILRLLAVSLFAFGMLGSLPKAQAQAGINFNHYACYDVIESTPFEPRTVTLRDQFGETHAAVVRPVKLCNPVAKNDEPVPDPDVHLVCYEIAIPAEIQQRKVQTWDQFGTLKLVVAGPNLLCVPARKALLE